MPIILKDKHRKHIWRDADGDLWFYDVTKEKWSLILSAWNGYCIDYDLNHEICGPFKRVK